MPDGHRTAELRSIAFHRLVAQRLDDDLLKSARARVDRWVENGAPLPPPTALRWQELLRQPPTTVVRRLTEDSDEMRDLRQNTPFAGAIPDRERWRIISEIR
jgi:hypothetical protein